VAMAFKEAGIAFLLDLKDDLNSLKAAGDRAQHFSELGKSRSVESTIWRQADNAYIGRCLP
jgi:hypothetical protein